jgi:cyclopropane fatty-acyl-phospholipid synthase-like methyltransferase
MAQITTGIRSILSVPIFYDLLQNVLGGKKARKELIEKYLLVNPNDRLLDIGCGTAEILDCLPKNITYVGFDASKDYIKKAKEKYQERNAQFFAKLVTDSNLGDFEPFDIVIALGILHHLEDEEVIHLFSLAKNFLKPAGRIITIDPCYIENQRILAKFMISRDRGQNVRTSNQYQKLAENIFSNVSLSVRNDLLRIPYDHAILECKI